jgi:uncharacterized protein (TIGR03067 family)
MKSLLSLFILILSVISLTAQDDATKEEVKKLQGNWVRTSRHADGKNTEDGDRPPDKQVRMEIKGNSLGGQNFTLDITQTPRHIDMTDVGPKGKQFSLPGIYELKGDVLKICVPFPFEGKFDQIHKRPTEFISKAGENNVVEVYRRVTK